MKMIIAILKDTDTDAVAHALISAGFRATRVATTGGFLRRGSTTLMIGLDDEKVEQAIQLIRDSCAPPEEVGMKRATVFVLKVDHFAQV
jgi:uncharacterized protein YaaQ